jgi:iron-sulfur cluster protein
MQTADTLKDYRSELRESLDNDFLRKTLDVFAVAYRTGRANAFKEFDVPSLVADVADIKDAAGARMMELFEEFRANATKAGVTVHLAKDADEANRIIAEIAENAGCRKAIKSKSMTAEETLLNHELEHRGMEVTESDLGEWIIQLRHEGPTHMVMPAIHLSRHQVCNLFSQVTGKEQDPEIERLVKVARRELRAKYIEADMGISGANFAIAKTGSIGIVTNEGNARLVTTLPRVHVALMGLDKLLPTLGDALKVLKVLPRNATGQAITSYVTWITGAVECFSAQDRRKEIHMVFLDNGRAKLASDPVFSQVLRCVRCGACANVCPVYRLVGGHKMGHIYIGAIGLILTYFFHGRDKAKNLVQNCINCGACKEICAGGIDLPRLIKEIHARIQDEAGHPLSSMLLGRVLRSRTLFHRLLRTAKLAQKPVLGDMTPDGGYLRHLPMIFSKDQNFRALPAIAEHPFRDLWPNLKPAPASPKHKAAYFSGCVQDFVYPDQAAAAIRSLAPGEVAVEFPMDQTCCGLPVQMMGEKKAAIDVAKLNIAAFEGCECEHILTTCASCASHLKHAYPKLLEGDEGWKARAEAFAEKVIDYSSYMTDVLGVDASAFQQGGKKVTYHAPCHLCRGMDVREAPRSLMATAGLDYAPCAEEETCCGFGGTFSMKFPELSKELLAKKLANVAETGAEELLTDCPGCVMQLRGGARNAGAKVRVRHIAEAVAEQQKR